MATVGEIARQASILLDDEAGRRYRSEHLRTWIGEAQREVSRRAECLRATATISTTADTQSITITQDVVRLVECYWYPTGSSLRYPLVYRDHRAMRPIAGSYISTGAGVPEVFWTQGYPGAASFTLHFFPTPSEAGSAIIHYYRFAAAVSTTGSHDATEIDLPAGWSDCVLPWVLMRAREASREYEPAAMFKGQFEERLGNLTDASVRFIDEPGSIVMDDWYDIYGDDSDW